MHDPDILTIALDAAVPLHIWMMRDWPVRHRINEAHRAAQVIAERGDVLMFGAEGSARGRHRAEAVGSGRRSPQRPRAPAGRQHRGDPVPAPPAPCAYRGPAVTYDIHPAGPDTCFDGYDPEPVYPYDPDANICIGCPGCLTGGRCIEDQDEDDDWWDDEPDDDDPEDWGEDWPAEVYVHGRRIEDVPTRGLL